ncbi:hypothetical protein OS175_07970 [Marinicella sp. S1101]|uniref:hypothetical protein n=1 Tax=Marinicella marina TaxID=2996016 RepID=UPI002260B1EF|nr:hypothetical protein [Marinicella marina]MCX7553811.1 hypothetical protein [Marinicella marina]MDJ1140887.1 hypothetical protein [Marinicella marina]
MKLDVRILEKLGQTQSIRQYDSTEHMVNSLGMKDTVFQKIKSQSQDLICLILPDDDDDDE